MNEVNFSEHVEPCYDDSEALVSASPDSALYPSGPEMLKLIHELRSENDQLRRAKEQSDIAKEKYAALYNLAPAAYFSVSRDGQIKDLNVSGLRMLDCIQTPDKLFRQFVTDDSRPVFDSFLQKIFYRCTKQSCEITISSSIGKEMDVHVSGVVTLNQELCLITAVDITETKAAKNELIAMNGLYADLVSSQTVGVYRLVVAKPETCKSIMDAFSMEYVNDRFRELFDLDHQVGLEYINSLVLHQIHPEDVESFIRSNEMARIDQLPYVWEGRLLKDDGIRWIRFDSGPRKLDNGNTRWTGVAIDITAQKQAEQTLRLSEQKHRQLYESIKDAIAFIDMTGKFVDSNLSYQKMVGYSAEELYEINYRDLTPEKWTCLENGILINQVLKLGYSESYEKEYIRKDGSIFPVEIRVFLLRDDHNQPTGIWGIARDITERKQAEAEIKQKNEELQKLNAEKDKFFSIIAHDLRSPFSGFLGLTEIMAESLPRMTLAEIQKIAHLMKDSAANLNRLLGNLLEWSCMRRGLTSFFPSTCLLMPKISASVMLVLDTARNKEIEIYLDIPTDFEVYADGNMLEGIIRNLLSNAVKFTPKKGHITIAARSLPDKSAEISIKDTGIGMNANILGNLFHFELNMNRKGTEGEYSTGLGLIICRDFIEKHGGRLWVESKENEGSQFYFSLPGNPASQN